VSPGCGDGELPAWSNDIDLIYHRVPPRGMCWSRPQSGTQFPYPLNVLCRTGNSLIAMKTTSTKKNPDHNSGNSKTVSHFLSTIDPAIRKKIAESVIKAKQEMDCSNFRPA
jgi:hypothetical protein